MRLFCILIYSVITAYSAERPNIVFIFSDDHALQAISAYGGRFKDIAPTPNIDKLAKQGALFERSYCTNSICGPSRAVIQTGKHSHINGFVDNDNGRFDGSQPTFPKYLQKAGYQTAVIGKWHLVTQPQGFDHWEILPDQGSYYNPDFIQMDGSRKHYPGYCTDLITDKALEWLKTGRDPSKPFVLMCQQKAPHRNWSPAERHYKLFDGIQIPEPETLFDDYSGRSPVLAEQQMTIARHMMWSNDSKLPEPAIGNTFLRGGNGEYARMTPEQKEAYEKAYGAENDELIKRLKAGTISDKELTRWKYQRYIKNYLRCVRAVDEGVGRVLDYLDASGLSKNTIVIYSSDQGFYLGEHGWYDKRWMFEESLAMPFLIRWPGVVKPGTRSQALIQNLDYAPTFLDAAGVKIPEDMQGASLLPLLKNEGKAPADWRKAIYYAYSGERTHQVAAHDGVRNDRYKLFHIPKTDEWQLFDLKNDPMELKSIHAEAGSAGILAEMKLVYQQLRTQYQVK